MATDLTVTEAWNEIFRLLRPRWLQEFGAPDLQSALAQLEEEARRGRPSSFPVVQGSGRVSWLSVAGSGRDLREYLDDLRAWLSKRDGAAIGRVVAPQDVPGPMSQALGLVAPHGYARWDCENGSGHEILRRLDRMHRFLSSRPELESARVPSLAALRLDFVLALKIGDWTRAEACVDEIDRWSLDRAPATVQMRLRLLDARGDIERLFEFARRHQAWTFTSPQRIAAALVGAVDVCAIQPVEDSHGIQAAFDTFRREWHLRLVDIIADSRGDARARRLAAFAAAADNDARSLSRLLPELPTRVAEYLRDHVPSVALSGPAAEADATPNPSTPSQTHPTVQETPTAASEEPPSAGGMSISEPSAYWVELHRAIKAADVARTRYLLAALEGDLPASDEFVAGASDGLLELLTDPAIESDSRASTLRYEALTVLVDGFVGAPGFPSVKHLEVYLSLLSGLVEVRGGTVSDADSQLVLGLGSAVAALSAEACPKCEDVFRALWRRRPVVPRLDWLTAALDTLAEVHPHPNSLVDLFADGLALAERKSLRMSRTKLSMWRRIGGALELPSADVERLLSPLIDEGPSEEPDLLATSGLRRIAIVSLREASATTAARELEARTGATVSVVTSLGADDQTRQATSADLILYVWAASTHAAYRAFDRWRSKLEYVQGTGASSIVMAAERWAARHANEEGRAVFPPGRLN